MEYNKHFFTVCEYMSIMILFSHLILTSRTNDSKDVFTFDHILLCLISPCIPAMALQSKAIIVNWRFKNFTQRSHTMLLLIATVAKFGWKRLNRINEEAYPSWITLKIKFFRDSNGRRGYDLNSPGNERLIQTSLVLFLVRLWVALFNQEKVEMNKTAMIVPAGIWTSV